MFLKVIKGSRKFLHNVVGSHNCLLHLAYILKL